MKEEITETTTELKATTMAGLIFNAAGEIMVSTAPDSELRIPNVSVPRDAEPTDQMGALVKKLVEFTGEKAGLGDVVFDDYSKDGTHIIVFLSFLESYEDVKEGTKWIKLSDIVDDEDDIMHNIHMHLINTLFNAQLMKIGNCYENFVTGEAYYVVHVINDNMRSKKFFIMESTMADEPLVLPQDALWGLPLKWVPHLRFMEVVQCIPETMAERARMFFIKAHNMTNHRYDGKPYSFHLAAVVNKFHKYKHLIPEDRWDQVEAELWGHDSLEDARLTYNDVKEAFNKDIAEGCYSMTNDKGRNRKARAGEAYYTGLATDEYGEFKKLCDRLANMENSISNGHSMGKQYKKEQEDFESHLRTHGDHYKEMWDELKELIK